MEAGCANETGSLVTTRLVTCSYCGGRAKFVSGDVVYGRTGPWSSMAFWYCAPCKAWVGCHKRNSKYGFIGDEPLGRLADYELRRAKRILHSVFDPLWKRKWMPRGVAYKSLAKAMGIPVKDCHIGYFDLNQCREAYVAVNDIRMGLSRFDR